MTAKSAYRTLIRRGKGRGIFAISGWVMKALGKDPVANARAVLRDALLDPGLARLLLAPDRPSTRRILQQRLRCKPDAAR